MHNLIKRKAEAKARKAVRGTSSSPDRSVSVEQGAEALKSSKNSRKKAPKRIKVSTYKSIFKPARPTVLRNPRLDPRLEAITRAILPDDRAHVELDSGKRLWVAGATSLDDHRYVVIADMDRVAFIPLSEFAAGGRGAFNMLISQGIVIVESVKPLIEAIAALHRFPRLPLIERFGWNGDLFVLPNGRVFAPKGVEHAISLVEPLPGVCEISGTLEGWKDGFASPLADQTIAGFFLMVMFAPPLLRFIGLPFNPGFELAGAGAVGKSTLLKQVSSAAGPCGDGAGGRYWTTCIGIANGAGAATSRHADMPMILDEEALLNASGSAASRAAAMTDLVFRLATGDTKTGDGDGSRSGARFVYALSTAVSLADAVKDRSPALIAPLVDRIATVPIEASRPHGTFDHLPPGYRNALAFSTALAAVVREHHGVALPAFLTQLVNVHAGRRERLQRFIDRRMAEFRLAVMCDPNDASAMRVADAFGLVYTAGRLACSFDVLPRDFECLRAARQCHALYGSQGRVAASPMSRLKAVMSRPDTIDLDTFPAKKLTKKRIEQTPGFFRTNRFGEREFLMLNHQRHRVFPDWFNLRFDATFTACIRHDANRSDCQRRLRPGGKKMYMTCFVLPARDADD